MKRIITLTLAALVTLLPAETLAQGKSAKNCPPGLAKKSPECVPPGLAKKGVTADDWKYKPGDRIDDSEFVVLREGDRVIFDGREYIVVDTDNGTVLQRGDTTYRFPRSTRADNYVRIGDALVKVNPETKEVIEFIRLADLIFG